eukprot:105129-Pleurochrysis_carterae.AAC.1
MLLPDRDADGGNPGGVARRQEVGLQSRVGLAAGVEVNDGRELTADASSGSIAQKRPLAPRQAFGCYGSPRSANRTIRKE